MNRRNQNNILLPFVIVMAVVTVVTSIWLFGGKGDKKKPSDAVEEGIAYLEARDEMDPGEVVAQRQRNYQAKIDAQRGQILSQLNDGTIDPFSMIKDYVLLGDSRAVGFWYRHFLDKNRVIADGGHTIRNLEQEVDQIVAMNPSQIFLCYGLNDTSIGYWKTADEYVAEYMQVVQEIRTKLPNATIVVSSILPAKDPAFQKSAKWYNIPEWSAALEQACKDNGILFANCDYLADSHANLWDPDGIHFRKEFYPYWASCLVAAILMEGVA